jgi:hypothetical protein
LINTTGATLRLLNPEAAEPFMVPTYIESFMHLMINVEQNIELKGTLKIEAILSKPRRDIPVEECHLKTTPD